MRALQKLDEPEEALREYERCREALDRFHHVKPAIESEQLYQTIRKEHPVRKSGSGAPVVPSHDQSQRDIHASLRERSRLRVGVLPFHADDFKNERSLAV